MLAKFYAKSVCGIIGIELLSWLTYALPDWRSVIFVGSVMAILAISCYRLEYGMYIALAELAIGSQGYILSLPLGSFTLSLRLGIFMVLLLAWLLTCLRQRQMLFWRWPYWKWYVALVGCIILGTAVGYWRGNDVSDIFFDVNGYLYLGLVPAFIQGFRTPAHIKRALLVLVAGVTILALQTMIILLLFSHQALFQYYLPDSYRWIRDFRLAEITKQANGFYRIFFQSHIYVLFLFCIGLVGLAWQRQRWWYYALVFLTTTLLLLSYSRSFWVATLATIIGFVWYARGTKWLRWSELGRIVSLVVVSAVVGYTVALGIVNVPLAFDSGAGVGAVSLLADRTDDLSTEAASGSRLALLGPLLQKNLQLPVLGGGFGTTVTYATLDPRALASHPDGLYTTFAFEWGYLDVWLKLGLLGAIIYLSWLIIMLIRLHGLASITRSVTDRVMLLGAGLGLAALMIVHALTPYLNHPLGIGWIVLCSVMTVVYEC